QTEGRPPGGGKAVIEWRGLPALNAGLNSLCTVLLVVGFVAIKRRKVMVHKTCMLSALAVSLLFLASYVYYHLVVKEGEPTPFRGEGGSRYAYLAILVSHTMLAMVAAPLALVTAYRGLRGQLDRPARIARCTLPLWHYLSISSVVVYWMLDEM